MKENMKEKMKEIQERVDQMIIILNETFGFDIPKGAKIYYFKGGYLRNLQPEYTLKELPTNSTKRMNNEKKAIEIATQNYCTNKRYMDISFMSSMKMADWKDEQIVDLLHWFVKNGKIDAKTCEEILDEIVPID